MIEEQKLTKVDAIMKLMLDEVNNLKNVRLRALEVKNTREIIKTDAELLLLKYLIREVKDINKS